MQIIVTYDAGAANVVPRLSAAAVAALSSGTANPGLLQRAASASQLADIPVNIP